MEAIQGLETWQAVKGGLSGSAEANWGQRWIITEELMGDGGVQD